MCLCCCSHSKICLFARSIASVSFLRVRLAFDHSWISRVELAAIQARAMNSNSTCNCNRDHAFVSTNICVKQNGIATSKNDKKQRTETQLNAQLPQEEQRAVPVKIQDEEVHQQAEKELSSSRQLQEQKEQARGRRIQQKRIGGAWRTYSRVS